MDAENFAASCQMPALPKSELEQSFQAQPAPRRTVMRNENKQSEPERTGLLFDCPKGTTFQIFEGTLGFPGGNIPRWKDVPNEKIPAYQDWNLRNLRCVAHKPVKPLSSE